MGVMQPGAVATLLATLGARVVVGMGVWLNRTESLGGYAAGCRGDASPPSPVQSSHSPLMRACCLSLFLQVSDLFNNHKEAPVLNKNSAPHSGEQAAGWG